MLRLLNAMTAMFAAVWIAGYVAIVAPVILKWMPPGQQNASFIFWANAGWVFWAIITLCQVIAAYVLLKLQKRIFAVSLIVLSLILCLFQSLGYNNTYAVRDSSELRQQYHENTESYKTADVEFQAAHKASERYIGALVFSLIICIGLHLSSVAINPLGNKQT